MSESRHSQPTASFPADDVIERFIAELDRSRADRFDLDGWIERHPQRERELRELARLHQTLDERDPRASMPETLGEFRIIRLIARGGMGDVYLAEQVSLKRPVAVKVIRRDGNGEDARQRFLREQKVLAGLHQTNIVPVHTAGQDGDLQYFAMPYIEGAALHHVLRSAVRAGDSANGRHTATLGGLAQQAFAESTTNANREATKDDLEATRTPSVTPLEYFRSVAHVIADAAEAVHHAHEAGILHRDVKPSNIMVDLQERTWLIDFGLSLYLHAGARGEPGASATGGNAGPLLTAAAGTPGTPPYMAPEQFGDDPEALDRRTDVWGLGATLYELLTGKRAFPGEKPSEIREKVLHQHPLRPRSHVADIPRDLEAIAQRALQKDPAARYATALEMAEDLRRWLRGEAVAARPTRALRRAWLWSKRNPGWGGTLYGGLAFAVVLLSILWRLNETANVANVAAAESKATAAEEKASEAGRAAALLQLQQIRHYERYSDWRTKAWELVRKAAAIRKDPQLRDQAAATLIGLDAQRVKEFEFGASAVAFDADGKRLLMGGLRWSVRDQHGKATSRKRGASIWDGSIHQPKATHFAGAGPVAFMDDVKPVQLISASQAGLRLVEVQSGREISQTAFQKAANEKRPLVLGTSAIGLPVTAMTPQATRIVGSAVFLDKNGQRTHNGLTAVWDGRTGKRLLQISETATAVALSPDGELLAVGKDDGRILIWSVSGQKQIVPLQRARSTIHCLAFRQDLRRRVPRGNATSPANWLLAAGDAGGKITIWDVGTRIPRSDCTGSLHAVYVVAFSPDGMTLASAGRRAARLWDVSTGRNLLQLGSANYIAGIGFSPNGRQLAVSSLKKYDKDQGVVVWGLEFGRGILSLRGLAGTGAKAVISPDGNLIAALSNDWTVGIWNVKQHRLLHKLEVPQGYFTDSAALAFNADGNRFAFSAGKQATLWDVKTGRHLKTWRFSPGLQDRLAFHKSGKLLSFRYETKGGKLGPFTENPWNKDPRLCRLRELLPDGGTKKIETIENLNRHIWALGSTIDGGTFVVDGVQVTPDRETREIAAYDGETGKRLWRTTRSYSGLFGLLTIDPKSSRVAAYGAKQLLDLRNGRARESISATPCSCLTPGGNLCAEIDVGAKLYRVDRKTPLLTLGIDNKSQSHESQFSLDGRLLAWANVDGSVFVADLSEVRRRLSEAGLDWTGDE